MNDRRLLNAHENLEFKSDDLMNNKKGTLHLFMQIIKMTKRYTI